MSERSSMKNAMSIDLEDWFCVYNLNQVIRREDWDKCELRVVRNTTRILDLFQKYNVRATFFVLGWIADNAPELVRQIEQRGHEIAVHGYNHLLITNAKPEEFERDLVEAIESLRRCGITGPLLGFRAPSFTVVEKTMWALPILAKHGIRYDSSVFPVGFHPDYGVPKASLSPFRISDDIVEFPLTCVEYFGKRFPCSGGAYFRLLPYLYTKTCIRKCNNEGRSAVFYLHPWEIDPDQPRMDIPLTKRIRHYYGLNKTERKLERLLQDFQFTTIREVLSL